MALTDAQLTALENDIKAARDRAYEIEQIFYTGSTEELTIVVEGMFDGKRMRYADAYDVYGHGRQVVAAELKEAQ